MFTFSFVTARLSLSKPGGVIKTCPSFDILRVTDNIKNDVQFITG